MMKLIVKAEELLEKYSFVPFGNSTTQNLFLLVQDDYSPGRKLRSYLCRLFDRVQAVREAYFGLLKEKVHLKRIKREIESETDELRKEELQIELESKLYRISVLRKLYSDALCEISDLIYAIESLQGKPNNREEFELQELEHFSKRLKSYLLEPEPVRGLKALGYKLIENANSLEVHIDDSMRASIVESLKSALISVQNDDTQIPVLECTQILNERGGDRNVDSLDK